MSEEYIKRSDLDDTVFRLNNEGWEITRYEYKRIDGVLHEMPAYSIPFNSVIEDIKAEINRKANSGQWSDATMYGMKKALAIIDKHIADMRGEI